MVLSLLLGRGWVLDELRERISGLLAAHQVAVVSTAASTGSWAMPASYRASGLEVDLLIPRWADVAFYLEQDPRVLLVILLGTDVSPRWLEYRGSAQLVAEPDWTRPLPGNGTRVRAPWPYVVAHVRPTRIDVFDESLGWNARETLDCPTQDTPRITLDKGGSVR